MINQKLIKALSACAVTVEKDAKKAAISYVKERAPIDVHAASMTSHEVFSSLLSSTDASASNLHRHLSLIIQIITIEYTEAFGELISYQGEEGGQSIQEKADNAFSHAYESDSSILFPKPKVRDNVYYIVGFLGTQAEKQAKRLAEASGR